MTEKACKQRRAVQPKHPQYSLEAIRLSSFSKWPATTPQKPSELCAAGFFYAGFSDCVRCFCCGGGLRNWEDDDIPWVEHAKWYSDCDFLEDQKGRDFIEKCQQNCNQQCPPVVEQKSTVTERDQMKKELETKLDDKESQELDRKVLAVRSVMEMGYSRPVVEAVVEQLVDQGNKSYSATDIMKILLETEETGSDLQVSQGPHNVASQKSELSAKAPASTSVDVQSLADENRELKDQMVCKICLNNEACIVYLPCGHMVTCEICADKIRKCCICRKIIQGRVRAYL